MGALSEGDPRRIAVIAVRTAPGALQAYSDRALEAIVIGEVAVAGGVGMPYLLNSRSRSIGDGLLNR